MKAAITHPAHPRTDRCRPCGMDPRHCDIHGKRFEAAK